MGNCLDKISGPSQQEKRLQNWKSTGTSVAVEVVLSTCHGLLATLRHYALDCLNHGPTSMISATGTVASRNYSVHMSLAMMLKTVHRSSAGVVGLRDSRLRSIPDAALGLGDAIRVVDVSNNNLVELSPSLAALINLQRLVLANNRLTAFPAALCNFPSLKILVLDSNGLHELPDEVSGLLRLEKLSANSNKLKALPAGLGNLKDLKSLSASSNSISEIPATLASCSSLQEIDLQSNAISSIPAALGQLKKLRTLNLDSNQVGARAGTCTCCCHVCMRSS
jgi:Leucine-rich repeat (LRR) protein